MLQPLRFEGVGLMPSSRDVACLAPLLAKEARFSRPTVATATDTPEASRRPRAKPSVRDATFVVSGAGDEFASRQRSVLTLLADVGILAPEVVTLPREATACRALSPCRRQWERCVMHPGRMYTLRHRMSSHGLVNYMTHLAVVHEVVRRNLSFALIIEDDAVLSLPARVAPPRALGAALDSLARASVDYSVMYVGGSERQHAAPSWREAAAHTVARTNLTIRAFRAPRSRSGGGSGGGGGGSRCAHGYVLSAAGARAWLERAPHATQQVDRHHEHMYQTMHNWVVDYVEPPLLCQAYRHAEHRNFTHHVDPDCPRIADVPYSA